MIGSLTDGVAWWILAAEPVAAAIGVVAVALALAARARGRRR